MIAALSSGSNRGPECRSAGRFGVGCTGAGGFGPAPFGPAPVGPAPVGAAPVGSAQAPRSAPAAPTPADTDIAEERRLLFVGLTRARAKLLLTCATRRTRYGADRSAGRSPFLAAIDPKLFGPPDPNTPQRPRKPADRQLRLL